MQIIYWKGSDKGSEKDDGFVEEVASQNTCLFFLHCSFCFDLTGRFESSSFIRISLEDNHLNLLVDILYWNSSVTLIPSHSSYITSFLFLPTSKTNENQIIQVEPKKFIFMELLGMNPVVVLINHLSLYIPRPNPSYKIP